MTFMKGNLPELCDVGLYLSLSFMQDIMLHDCSEYSTIKVDTSKIKYEGYIALLHCITDTVLSTTAYLCQISTQLNSQ